MIRLRVKELVEQRGLTWQKFGADTGLSKQTIYSLMTGKVARLDLRTLEVLCTYFEVSPNDLLEIVDDSVDRTQDKYRKN